MDDQIIRQIYIKTRKLDYMIERQIDKCMDYQKDRYVERQID